MHGYKITIGLCLLAIIVLSLVLWFNKKDETSSEKEQGKYQLNNTNLVQKCTNDPQIQYFNEDFYYYNKVCDNYNNCTNTMCEPNLSTKTTEVRNKVANNLAQNNNNGNHLQISAQILNQNLPEDTTHIIKNQVNELRNNYQYHLNYLKHNHYLEKRRLMSELDDKLDEFKNSQRRLRNNFRNMKAREKERQRELDRQRMQLQMEKNLELRQKRRELKQKELELQKKEQENNTSQ